MRRTEPDKGEVVEVIRARLAEILEMPLESIPENAHLRDDLDADSLQQLELVSAIEETFGVMLDADDLSELSVIEELADRTLERLGAA